MKLNGFTFAFLLCVLAFALACGSKGKKSDGNPVCAPECLNGGVCVATNVCDCTGTGYSGARCENPLDDDVPDGDAVDGDAVDGDDDVDGDADGDDPDDPQRRYPKMGDGKDYANMLKLLDSLGGIPDYRIGLPSSLSSPLDNDARKRRALGEPFDPDAFPDMMSRHYDDFRHAAAFDHDVTFIKGLVGFLKDYLDENAVPQGVATHLGDEATVYFTEYGAYHQEIGTRLIDPGVFLWLRDDDGKFTLYWRMRMIYGGHGGMSYEFGPYEYYTIVGSPLPAAAGETTLYTYNVYRVEPTQLRGMDQSFWSLSYNEASTEVETYWRTNHLTTATENEDNIYFVEFRYTYVRPDPDSETNSILFYTEDGRGMAEVDPTTGNLVAWYDQEGQTELGAPEGQTYISAYGDDTGAVLLTGSGELLDENGNLILRYIPAGCVTETPTCRAHTFEGQNVAAPGDTQAPTWVWSHMQSADPPVIYWIATDIEEAPDFSAEEWSLLQAEQFAYHWQPGDRSAEGDTHYTWRGTVMQDTLPIQKYEATYTLPAPVIWFGNPTFVETDWPLKYIRTTTEGDTITLEEIELPDGNPWWYFWLGEWRLPVVQDYLGRYNDEREWEVVNIPFFRAFSLPPQLEVLPEIQEKIDAQGPVFEQMIHDRRLPTERHPAYRFPEEIFEAIITSILDGVWVREVPDGKVDVLLVDSNTSLTRFEYRRYAPVDPENPDGDVILEQGASGRFEAVHRRPTLAEGNVEVGWSLEFRTTSYYVAETGYWELEPVHLTLPDFLRTGSVIYKREGRTLNLHFKYWDRPDSETFVFERALHDPMLVHQAQPAQPVAPPSNTWTAVADDGSFVETSFMADTWQEVHFMVNANRDVQVLRAFRGDHSIDMSTGRGTVHVTMIYDGISREWISADELPDIFAQMAQEDAYLEGLIEWQVQIVVEDDDSMTMTIEEPGPADGYSYSPHGSGVDLSACLFNACVTVEASHCEQAIGGPMPGRGMSLPVAEWDNTALPACTNNCYAQSMCARSERTAYYIDCANQIMLCSRDWTPIDAGSCNKVRSLLQINDELRDCRHRCQMDLEVVFPDPAPMIDTLTQCVDKYGAIIP